MLAHGTIACHGIFYFARSGLQLVSFVQEQFPLGDAVGVDVENGRSTAGAIVRRSKGNVDRPVTDAA